MSRPTTPHQRREWLRIEREIQRNRGLSPFEANDEARRKLFRLDCAAARSVADLRDLMLELADQVVWRERR